MIKNCIIVRYGLFPEEFPTILPGHHCFPNKADEFNGYPAIMLQRKIHTGHKSVDSFDIMYFMSIETHIFTEVFRHPPFSQRPTHPFSANPLLFRAQLNHAQQSGQQFVPGEPGCWWIKLGDFVDKTDIDPTDPITSDLILQVPCQFPPSP